MYVCMYVKHNELCDASYKYHEKQKILSVEKSDELYV